MRWIALPLVLLVGCTTRPVEKVALEPVIEDRDVFPLNLEKDFDILFVIDNSNSMGQEQVNLSQNFPKFIDALRNFKLGPDGSGKPCTPSNQSGCKIPNVHIGVVSTDLGAGNYGLPSCEVSSGDRGKLQSQPRIAGCVPPSKPYIDYNEGVTNIASPTKDPVTQVKEAFQCIAEIGTGGCGFEHTLEAARRALDPALNLNPGFIRDNAYLAIVFITDEDDCSAQKPQLFDSNQTDLSDPLGPLTSFRCFEFGIECDINDRTKPGPRKSCRPAYDWLYKVQDYVDFFKTLKKPERIIVSALAGPTDKVEVGFDGQSPNLRPSCQTKSGNAAPALRIKGVVDAFGDHGQFSTICTDDFGPALKELGDLLVTNLNHCLDQPPLTPTGMMTCSAGAVVSQGVTCQQGCLEQADCVVREVTYDSNDQEHATVLTRCESDKFTRADDKDCGAICPCWRIVPSPSCDREGRTGYKLEILRKGEPPQGASAVLACQASALPWGSLEFSQLPQCK